MATPLAQLLDSGDSSLYQVRSRAPGPRGSLPLTPEMLLKLPSGDLFGWSQDAGMGWTQPRSALPNTWGGCVFDVDAILKRLE
jgi:hypothetical protein